MNMLLKIVGHLLLLFSSVNGATSNTFRCGAVDIVVKKGDITKSQAQIIVNAANEQLAGGAGVCGAIFTVAGWDKLTQACNAFLAQGTVRCPTGEAKITDSFDLKRNGIEYIIHAVGPDCRIITDPKQQDILLKKAYQNSLVLAQKANVQSIAFPFISSAIYAFPKKRAAQVALQAVQEFIQQNDTTLKTIRFVLFLQEDLELFSGILNDLQKKSL